MRISDRESSNGSISPGVSEVGEPSTPSKPAPAPSPPPPAASKSDDAPKPRIWSLAHTAMSGSERPSLLPPGFPPLPKITSSHASPLYPYSSAFSPLKPWLGRPYPVSSLAALGVGALAPLTAAGRGLAQVSTVSSSALTEAVSAASAASAAAAPPPPPPRSPALAPASPGAAPRAALSPRERFSVSELCRKDEDGERRLRF